MSNNKNDNKNEENEKTEEVYYTGLGAQNNIEETMFSLLYIMVKENSFHQILAIIFLIVEDFQVLNFVFRTEWFPTMPHIVPIIVDVLSFEMASVQVLRVLMILMFILVIAVISSAIYVAISFHAGRFKSLWPILILRNLTTFLMSIFYIPCVHIFVGFITCSEGYLVRFSEVKCYTTSHYPFFIGSIIGLCLFIPYTVLMSSVFVDPLPFNKGNPLTKPSGREDLIYCFFRLFLIVLENITKITIHSAAPSMYLLSLGIIYMIYKVIRHQPLHNATFNRIRAGIWSGVFLSTFPAIICSLMNEPPQKDWSWITALALIVPGFIFGFLMSIKSHRMVTTGIYNRLREKKKLDEITEEKIRNNEIDPEDLEHENVVRSMDRIATSKFIRKKVKVFKCEEDCELVCRFVRYNRNPEAYQLMRMLFDEGIKQFPKEAFVFIQYCFYLFSMQNFNKSYSLLDDDNKTTPYKLLERAAKLRPAFDNRFFISFATQTMEQIKKSKELDSSKIDISTFVELETLESSAIKFHISTLNELKILFKKLKESTNPKDCINYTSSLKKISEVQSLADEQYVRLLTKFTGNREARQMYFLFLKDVLNLPEKAAKYYTDDKVLKMVNDSKDNYKSNSSLYSSNNKLNRRIRSADLLRSNNQLTAYSKYDRELIKELSYRKNMQKVFIKPIEKYVIFFEMIIYLNFIILAIGSVFNIVTFYKISDKLDEFETSLKASYLVTSLCEKYRIMQLGAACQRKDIWLEKIEETKPLIEDIDNNLLELLNKYSTLDPSGNEITLLYSNQNRPSKYEYNLYQVGYMVDRMSTFISSTEYDFSKPENILFDTPMRFFLDNEKVNFNSIMKKTSDMVLEELNSKINSQIYILIGTTAITTILYIISTFFGLNPLLKLISKIQIEVLRMFRHIPTKYIDDLIEKLDKQREIIYLNFKVADESKSSNKKDDDLLNSKKTKNNLFVCYSSLCIFVICGAMIFIPAYVTESSQSGMIDLIHKSSTRLQLMRSSFIYTMETKIQDRITYLPGESERLLTSTINDLKTIQHNIRYGKYKAPPSIEIDVLYNLLVEPSCKRNSNAECDERVYDHDLGYTQNISELPLDDLISHYISVAEEYIINNKNNNYTDYYNELSCNQTLSNIEIDRNIQLQETLLVDIIDGLFKFDHLIIQELKDENDSAIEISIILLIVCFTINIAVYKFRIKSVMDEKKHEMNDLITLAFMIPRDVINKAPPYKKFIETGETNDD
ncbi:hypothetical protein BCR32DRAFT_291357 [Anaeromyces robustus]|uniref:TmcB/TmcC TPR repeats domain-containing protein n=1 Tax=Anaeromyces robustus TaxID=1754192 RepID=A0A1Y1XF72_9FUNG|nr:hypothetical protein BCR32DRAFT_291357 [Anaeromyces robustus]|eukprot:ORX84373.1 hypothetical protein BCR32DRAFT_291357 [Anaeromyces robustus]